MGLEEKKAEKIKEITEGKCTCGAYRDKYLGIRYA
jgi:hypothetical protein